MTRIQAYWLAALGLTAATWAASAYLYPIMPDRVPTHWNIHGEVDGYGSKFVGLFLTPAIVTGLLVLFWFLPALSPQNFQVDEFKGTYVYVMLVTTGLMAYIHGVILYGTMGGKRFDMGRLLIGGIFLFMALLGNVMGKVRRNFYIGVRVPWTLASDRVWNDTHRLAAWLMVGGSVIGFLIVASGQSIFAAFVILMVSVLIPVVYSFVHYKKLEREGGL